MPWPDWRLVLQGTKFSDERLRFAAYVGPVLPLIAAGMTYAKRSQKMAHLLAFNGFVAIFPPRAYVWAMSYFGALSSAALSGKIVFTVELFLPVLVHGIFWRMCLGGNSSKMKKKKKKRKSKVTGCERRFCMNEQGNDILVEGELVSFLFFNSISMTLFVLVFMNCINYS